jgi:hypothetical protein
MTRQLQELFNLPDDSESDNVADSPKIKEDIPQEFVTPEMLSEIEKIEQALPAVTGLEASDQEMDELSLLAKDAFNNLLDLGMQVDSRFASEIFNSASSMLGHAITAKVAKTNKKLKMIQLQLQKADLDRKIAYQEQKNAPPATPDVPLGEGQVLDRNDLIKQILAQSKADAEAAQSKPPENDK